MDVQSLHFCLSPSSWHFGALAHGFAVNGGCAGRTAAAIFGQKSKKCVHPVELSSIDHRPAFASHGDKPSHSQPIKMKRERVWRETELAGNGPGRHAVRSRLDKQPKDIKATVLSECAQGSNGIGLFHISRIVEIIGAVKKYFNNH
jgi:hypothetical protein